MKNASIAAPLMLFACACSTEGPATELELAKALAAACPIGQTDDSAARIACADALTELDILRDTLADEILWGGQPKDMPLDRVIEDASLTEFNTRVWRRMYLSTFMFEGEPRVEVAGAYNVLHLPARFRNMLPAGEYPYPFWHSEKKWASYEQSVEVLMFFQDGKMVAAVRSEVVDPSRPHNPRMWDGAWTWEEGSEPRASLYSFLFSPMNPNIERLETTYREFSEGMRRQTCMTCHSPDNSAKMQHLELLNYPNQALSGRHDVVRVLEEDAMPPGVGVSDTVVRLDLLRLATAFAQAGDDALAFEGEVVQ